MQPAVDALRRFAPNLALTRPAHRPASTARVCSHASLSAFQSPYSRALNTAVQFN
jgi:hypothetical protein